MMASNRKRKKNLRGTGTATPAEGARKPLRAVFDEDALRRIRRHARGSMDMEICGALIGEKSGRATRVNGAVRGDGAAHGGAHVTFTQEAWNSIHEAKNRDYPGQAIVGWYHSHPGFGVFLSDHDLFIHQNFFNDPGSIAWVYDPHSEEEGCFALIDGRVQRITRYEVSSAGTTEPEPRAEPMPWAVDMPPARARGASRRGFARRFLLLILWCTAFVLGVAVGRLIDGPWLEDKPNE